MRRKHRSILQDHVRYIHNDIVNPFIFGIIQHAKRVSEMHYLAKYLHPPLTKGQEYDEAD